MGGGGIERERGREKAEPATRARGWAGETAAPHDGSGGGGGPGLSVPAPCLAPSGHSLCAWRGSAGIWRGSRGRYLVAGPAPAARNERGASEQRATSPRRAQAGRGAGPRSGNMPSKLGQAGGRSAGKRPVVRPVRFLAVSVVRSWVDAAAAAGASRGWGAGEGEGWAVGGGGVSSESPLQVRLHTPSRDLGCGGRQGAALALGRRWLLAWLGWLAGRLCAAITCSVASWLREAAEARPLAGARGRRAARRPARQRRRVRHCNWAGLEIGPFSSGRFCGAEADERGRGSESARRGNCRRASERVSEVGVVLCCLVWVWARLLFFFSFFGVLFFWDSP